MEQTHDRNTQPESDAVSDVWGEWMLSDVYHRVYLRLYLLLRRPPPPLLWSPSLSDSHKLLPQHIIHPQSLWLYFQKGWLNLNMNDHAEIDREKSWTTSSSQTLYVNSNVWRSWESAACCSVWGVQEYAGVRGGGIRLPRYPGVSLSSELPIYTALIYNQASVGAGTEIRAWARWWKPGTYFPGYTLPPRLMARLAASCFSGVERPRDGYQSHLSY